VQTFNSMSSAPSLEPTSPMDQLLGRLRVFIAEKMDRVTQKELLDDNAYCAKLGMTCMLMDWFMQQGIVKMLDHSASSPMTSFISTVYSESEIDKFVSVCNQNLLVELRITRLNIRQAALGWIYNVTPEFNDSAPQQSLCHGQRVRVQGLSKSPQYNGLNGSIVRRMEGGRYGVEMEGEDKKVLSVKGNNLKACGTARA
jgi:hypothetical protein